MKLAINASTVATVPERNVFMERVGKCVSVLAYSRRFLVCERSFSLDVFEFGNLIFLMGMEANFILKTSKLLTSIWGPVLEWRLKNMFCLKDPLLIRSVKLVLGEDLGVIGHRYRSRADLYSLITVWGLELDSSCARVRKVMKAIIIEEYLVNTELLLEWAISNEGFDVSERLEAHQDLRGRYITFLRRQKEVKARYRELARRGW